MRRATLPSITSSYLPVIGPVGAELRHEFTFDHSIGRHASPSVVDSFSRADFASERACSQSYFPIVSTLTPCRPSVRQAGNSAPALCACQPCLFTLDNLRAVRINRTGPQTARVLPGSTLQLERGSAGRFLVSRLALGWPVLAENEIVLGSGIKYKDLGWIRHLSTSNGR